MSLLSNLEGSLEKYIEGFFQQKYKGWIQPTDIAKKLAREMRERRRVSINHVYVPNEYKVFLHPEDWQGMYSIIPLLEKELEEFLVEKAREKNFTLATLPEVTIEKDEALGKCCFRIESTFSQARQEKVTGGEREGALTQAGQQIDNQSKYEDTLLYHFTEKDIRELVTPEKIDAQLIIVAGEEKGKVISLEVFPVTIGRNKNCDVVLSDPSVSRHHARLVHQKGQFILSDLGSTNGTFVNGKRISTQVLKSGDTVKTGATLWIFKVE